MAGKKLSWLDKMPGDWFGIPGVCGHPHRPNRRTMRALAAFRKSGRRDGARVCHYEDEQSRRHMARFVGELSAPQPS